MVLSFFFASFVDWFWVSINFGWWRLKFNVGQKSLQCWSLSQNTHRINSRYRSTQSHILDSIGFFSVFRVFSFRISNFCHAQKKRGGKIRYVYNFVVLYRDSPFVGSRRKISILFYFFLVFFSLSFHFHFHLMSFSFFFCFIFNFHIFTWFFQNSKMWSKLFFFLNRNKTQKKKTIKCKNVNQLTFTDHNIKRDR